jgi:hypothetical protein
MATISACTLSCRICRCDAKIDIETLSVISGSLPARARGLVIEWDAMHQVELREAFQKAAKMQAPGKIDLLP